MTFLLPDFLVASFAVAAAVVALHFIVTRQPRAGVLPTARFVPDIPATATARATRPSDLLLMLLRVLLVLAVGLALARPVFKPSRSASARVILVDASRSVGNTAAVRDSARKYYRTGDAVIVFDSVARSIGGKTLDSLGVTAPSKRGGRISAALIAALRAGSGLRDRADSLDLVMISPFEADEIDAATDSIRMLWPGKARLVEAGARVVAVVPSPTPVQIRSMTSDPLVVTLARIGSVVAKTRIVRDAPNTEDLAWVNQGERTLVDWPAVNRPRGTSRRASLDTIGGVIADNSLVVASFPRKWKFTPDSIRGAEVVARWTDGEPAAVEWATRQGCVRSSTVPVNPIGDLPIRTSFIRFVAVMSRECSGRGATGRVTPAALASLAGTGGLAPRDAFTPRQDVRSPLAPWLFGLALVAALAELFVRRRRSDGFVVEVRESLRRGRAA